MLLAMFHLDLHPGGNLSEPLTGENYPIPVPPVTLRIDPDAVAVPAPELDLLTQLWTIAATQGTRGARLVFEEIAYNQYDPIQDYLVQNPAGSGLPSAARTTKPRLGLRSGSIKVLTRVNGSRHSFE